MNLRPRIAGASLPGLCVLLAAGLLSGPVPASYPEQGPQSEESADSAERPASEQPEADEQELSRRERKQRAKERRIREYLRKREERRARREMERQARETKEADKEARAIERRQLAAEEEAAERARREAAAPPEPDLAEADEMAERDEKDKRDKKKKRATERRAGRRPSRLPRGLARAQANVRATELAEDSTVQQYLDRIDDQRASPHQLAAFANFIAQNGMTRDALEYYEVALRLEPRDAVLWINAGTLHMQRHDLSAAASAFGRALSLEPNNAVAHYNMGTVLDEMDRYEDAIASYRTALSLDPSLGDPAENPQAANNDLLLAVKLMLYEQQAGSLSMPLLDVSPEPAETADEEP